MVVSVVTRPVLMVRKSSVERMVPAKLDMVRVWPGTFSWPPVTVR